VAYRADIEIGVRGVRQLEQLRSEVNKTATAVDSLNAVVGARGGLVQSIKNYANQLDRAAQSLRNVGAGTRAETKAVEEYVTALGRANAARERQNALIDAEIKRRQEAARVQKLTASGIFETTRYAYPIGPSPASQVALSSPLRGRLQQIIDERKGAKELEAALLQLEERRRREANAALDEKAATTALRLEREKERAKMLAGAAQQYAAPIGPTIRSRRFRFEGDTSVERAEAALRARELANQRKFNEQFFQEEKKQQARLEQLRRQDAAARAQQFQRLRAGAGNAVSNALIGGAFPLLFGQGGGAAAGGAIGGIAGSLFLGGAGGFAGSLLGTLIGDLAEQGKRIKDLANDIGFSAQQTKQLETAFSQAGAQADKFQASVQNIRGLGLTLEDQANSIRLVSALTAIYGGQIDKVTNAFTSALESGKVTQATLNQLTSQGIPIQDALAKKYNVSRDAILKMAKDGTISVQTLADVLVDMGNKGEAAGQKPKSAFDQFTTALQNTSTAIGNLATKIAQTLAPVLDALLIKATSVLNAINSALAAGQIGVPQKQAFKRQAESIVSSQAGILPGGPFGAGRIQIKANGKTYTGQASSVVSDITNDLINKEVQRLTPKPVTTPTGPIRGITVPSQAEPSGAGASSRKRKSDAEKAAEAAERERQRVAEIIRDRLAEGQILKLNSDLQDRIAAAEATKNASLVARLQGEQRLLEIQYEYARLLAEEKDINAQKAIIYEGLSAQAAAQTQTQRELAEIQRQTDQSRLESLQAYIEKQYELNTAVQQQLDLADSVSDTLGQGLTSAFGLLIEGSDAWGASLKNIASNILVELANQLIRIFVIEQAINAIRTFLTPFSAATPIGAGGGTVGRYGTLGPNYGIPQREKGGPVTSGMPYIVGERGPELFVPGRSGTIVPNNAMGSGSVQVGTINISVENTGDQLSPQAQKQIAGQVRGIVLATLVDQQRSGGVLR
jgi:tape measure domain-containing protein